MEFFPFVHTCRRYEGSPLCYLGEEARTTAERRLKQAKEVSLPPLKYGTFTTPFTASGKLKSHDWFLLASPVGEYAYWAGQARIGQNRISVTSKPGSELDNMAYTCHGGIYVS